MKNDELESDKRSSYQDNVCANEGGVLAALLRKYIMDRGYIPYLNILIDKAVSREADKATSNKLTKTTRKGQFLANINSGSITWKVFIMLMSKVFGVKKFRLTIDVEHADKTISSHSVVVNTNAIISKYDSPEDLKKKQESLEKEKEEEDGK